MAKTSKSQRSGPPVQAAGKIGLWGAPTSGKTTFLAALSVAATRKRDQRVRLIGVDDESTEFLVELTTMLTTHLRFPAATDIRRDLNWVMYMPVETSARRFGSRADAVRYAFNLKFIDAPGRWFGHGRGSPAPAASHLFGDEPGRTAPGDGAPASGDADAFRRDLANCDGLVLLFDPTREWQSNDVFEHFYATLMKIAQHRLRESNGMTDLLPQYVAVCTTKFDDFDVYRKAYEQGFVSPAVIDGRFLPRVNDVRAEEFFVAIGKEAPLTHADLVRDMLRSFFEEDRVKFFVSSAIGFHLRPDESFDDRDFGNVDERSGPVARIRGSIYPINVIEPLMWLGQKLAEGQ